MQFAQATSTAALFLLFGTMVPAYMQPDQKNEVRDIEKLIRTSLPVSRHPDIPQEQFTEAAAHSKQPFNRAARRFPSRGHSGFRGHPRHASRGTAARDFS